MAQKTKNRALNRMSAAEQFIFVRAGKLHFFCPLCHYHQSTNTVQSIHWKHHLQIVVLTATSMLFAWPVFGLKGASLYLFFWGLFEFGYRTRKRQALICRSCGFDPFLYKQDMARARAALKQHWQAKIENEKLFAGIKLKNYDTAPKQDNALGQENISAQDTNSRALAQPAQGNP